MPDSTPGEACEESPLFFEQTGRRRLVAIEVLQGTMR